MKSRSAVILSAVLATALGSASAFGQEGPGHGEVEIKDMTANGSGCPIGTATVTVTNSDPDGPVDSGKVLFEEFIVEKPGKARKFCNLALDLKFPQGWSYTIDKVNIPGYAEIQEGVTATVSSEASFRGTSARAKKTRKQEGYWEGSFELEEGFGQTVWSPCGRVLPLNLKITATLGGESDVEDGSVLVIGGEESAQYFSIRWRRC